MPRRVRSALRRSLARPLACLGLSLLLGFFARPALGADLASALWTPEELAGSPGDRLQGALHQPDDTPPARTAPRRVLPPREGAGAVRRVEVAPGSRVVALTFDLCELADRRAGYDAELVALLRRERVAATFFAGGRWMMTHPEKAMQLMADQLFEVGAHGWTHGNMGVLDAEGRREQILWTQAQYELLREELARRAGGAGLPESAMVGVSEVPALFRPPYARCSPEALRELAGHGLTTVLWDVVADEGNPDARDAARSLAGRVRPGSIVLLHANGVPPHTARIVKEALPLLRARGYSFVTVSGLLRAGRAEASRDCWFTHPGDSRIYDQKYGDGTRRPRHPGQGP